MIATRQNAPIKILLAEDDKDDRFFFEEALRGISISTEINTVNDGDQLMDYLAKTSVNIPDMLFLDISMPRKNGFECLSEIKENIIFSSIYVIMFSTLYPRDVIYESDIIKRLYNMGAQDYIRKPSDFSKFKDVIQLAISRAIKVKNHIGLERMM
jgi:CheY-like chemotaxis protein